jgi:hypothetical protein
MSQVRDICLDLVILDEEYTIMNLLFVHFLHYHITSCLLGQNSLVSRHLSFSSSLSERTNFKSIHNKR